MKRKNNKIIDLILELYHLDKLCPNCNGPLETYNSIHCDLCDLRKHMKGYIDVIETTCIHIRSDVAQVGRAPYKSSRSTSTSKATTKTKTAKKPMKKKVK